MRNESLHSFPFVIVEVLQTGALTCVTSSFSYLRPLLLVINARYKCVTYLEFVHYWMTKSLFLDSSVAPLFMSLSMWQDRNNLKFHLSVFHVLAFIVRWCFVYPRDTCRAKVQEKKAMVGLKEGLLSRKHRRDNEPSKGEDLVVTSSTVLLAPQHLASPTSSLEMITTTDRVARSKRQDRVVVGTF